MQAGLAPCLSTRAGHGPWQGLEVQLGGSQSFLCDIVSGWTAVQRKEQLHTHIVGRIHGWRCGIRGIGTGIL